MAWKTADRWPETLKVKDPFLKGNTKLVHKSEVSFEKQADLLKEADQRKFFGKGKVFTGKIFFGLETLSKM